MSEENLWSRVQKTLIDNGIDTYPPAQKVGDCKDFYTVLKPSGATQKGTFSTEIHYYDLLCYAPRNKFVQLLDYVVRCKEVMAKEPIFPALMPTGVETPPFFDDTNNSYMISVQYRNNVRNTHL